MEKKITYLDRNEYNYGPCPAVGEVTKNFDRTIFVSIPVYMMKVKKVYSQIISLRSIIFLKNKSFSVMVEKIS